MKARLPELLLAALAVVLAVGGVVGLTQDREVPAAAPAVAGSTDVAIEGYLFGPKALTVPVGSTVTWTQSDATKHTVTGGDAASKGLLDSENLAEGDTYEVSFDEVGAFAYFCVFHPNMQGTITVEG